MMEIFFIICINSLELNNNSDTGPGSQLILEVGALAHRLVVELRLSTDMSINPGGHDGKKIYCLDRLPGSQH